MFTTKRIIFGLLSLILVSAVGEHYYISVGDFNGDGRDDILQRLFSAWGGKIYLSNGDGTFQKIDLPDSTPIPAEFVNLYVGDFNGDGKDDIFRQEHGSYDDDEMDTAGTYLSNGDGSFKPVVIADVAPMKGDLTNLYIGDFNRDGKDDVLRQERGSGDDAFNTADIYLSNGDGSYSITSLPEDLQIKGEYTRLYIGDFAGDGKDEFISEDHYYNAEGTTINTLGIRLFLWNDDGTFTWNFTVRKLGGWTTLFVGDFNGDGRDDILRQGDDFDNTPNVFLSNGDASFSQIDLPQEFGIKDGVTFAHIGDFNGDGKDDIFVQTLSDKWNLNRGTVFLSDENGSFQKQQDISLKGSATPVNVGDFDGDGKTDFIKEETGIWDDKDYHVAYVYLSKGDGSFKKIPIPEPIDPGLLKSRSQIMRDIAMSLQKSLASIANYLGYAWTGGCGHQYAGVGMSITENQGNIIIEGFPCHQGESDGYMSEHRLRITLGDWQFVIKEMILGDVMTTERVLIRPDKTRVINEGNETLDHTPTVEREVARSVEQYDLNTLTWQVGAEVSSSATVGIPGVASGSFTVTLSAGVSGSHERGTVTTDSYVDKISSSILVKVPPKSQVVVDIEVYGLKTNVGTSVAFLEARFSVEFHGFLKWGGGTGNYHRQHRGSDQRPFVTYKLGDQATSFNEALERELAFPESSLWDWNLLKQENPDAESWITEALDKKQYSNKEYFAFNALRGSELVLIPHDPEPL